ncbi:MAG: maleylpyruvate isomerase family mycothiol-dependent enzyme [Anaerolineae bacterium]|nr:maleylpyruvate isomerase family mycothiol-dependent enzyme [Anaerolineae bacterium]
MKRDSLKPVEPILVVELFPRERDHLLTLLARLSPEEWNRPTACAGWSVKDVALHLLGDDIGLLSRAPDFKFKPIAGVESWQDLVAFINHNNKLWVQAMRRMSTGLLVELLAFTGQKVYQRLRSLDLFALGSPVSWAGPHLAPIWLDVAREYTERWMHHQHIREAVHQPGLKEPSFFGPVLATFGRALPHTYRTIAAPKGAVIKVVISGEAGGTWLLLKEDEGWGLYQGQAENFNTLVTMDQEFTWRLFTKGIRRDEAEKSILIEGNRALALPILDAVAIIA